MALSLLFVSYIAALVLTYSLIPLWMRIERAYGFKLLGHGIVLESAFYAVFAVCLAFFFGGFLLLRKPSR